MKQDPILQHHMALHDIWLIFMTTSSDLGGIYPGALKKQDLGIIRFTNRGSDRLTPFMGFVTACHLHKPHFWSSLKAFLMGENLPPK